eukprot:13963090-Alexandrium_andersonii.AAC.1
MLSASTRERGNAQRQDARARESGVHAQAEWHPWRSGQMPEARADEPGASGRHHRRWQRRLPRGWECSAPARASEEK